MASLLWKSEGNSIIPYLIYGKGLVIMGFARKDVEATKRCEKKFVRYQKALKIQSWIDKIPGVSKEAKATYKIDKVVLVNCEIFEKYLETFREY